jgi:hypothetical protein
VVTVQNANRVPLIGTGSYHTTNTLSLSYANPGKNDINRQSEHRHFYHSFDLKTSILKGLPDIDRATIDILCELIVCPFVEPDRRAALLLFCHGYDADATVGSKNSLALVQHNPDFRCIEQFEGETHVDGVEEVGFKRESRRITTLQFYAA